MATEPYSADALDDLRRILLAPEFLADALEPLLEELLRQRTTELAQEVSQALIPTLSVSIAEALRDELRRPTPDTVAGLAEALAPAVCIMVRDQLASQHDELTEALRPTLRAMVDESLAAQQPPAPPSDSHGTGIEDNDVEGPGREDAARGAERHQARRGCGRLMMLGATLLLLVTLGLWGWRGILLAASPDAHDKSAIGTEYAESVVTAWTHPHENDSIEDIEPTSQPSSREILTTAPLRGAWDDTAEHERSPGLSQALSAPASGRGILTPHSPAQEYDMPTATSVMGSTNAPTPSGESKVLYLTFDDGPHPVWTPQILEVLERHGAKATFFVIGQEAARRLDLVDAVVGAGHVVGHHTWSHRALGGIDRATFYDEIEQTTLALGDAVSPCLRPPGGMVDEDTRAYAREMGLEIHRWRVDPMDWLQPGADEIARIVIDQASPGHIVLLHDGGGNRSQTVAALSVILEELGAQGYTFEPLCQK
jgi:peptidoglycan/xylan/chitin deacetylase (PgdA/CDA1 family)